MFKILMTYKSTEGLEALFNNKNFNVEVHPKPDVEKLKKLIEDVDGILIRSEVKITADIINAAKKLKIIARAGTGVDNVDVKTATQKGIAVINVPGGNTIAACEHTMALILALARNIPDAYISLRQHKWEREKFIGMELLGKTIGLIGFGRIAREVAERCKSFGMKVLAYDPYIADDFAKSMNVAMVNSLDEIFKTSDIISLHVPLSDSTKNLINRDAISKMKPGTLLINTARGAILNIEDVTEAVKAGKIRLAVDVFPEEPPQDFTLIDSNNVVATPHLGASTEEAQVKIAKEISECLVEFFEKGIIRNAVNMPSIDIETFNSIKPYLHLAEKLGKFQSQITEGAIKKVNLSYTGETLERSSYFLTVAYLKGLLSSIMEDETISYINALSLAKDRGIVVNESKSSQTEDFSTLITTQLYTESDFSELGGTVFSKNIPRIVKMDKLPIDINPSGCMLFVRNTDKPGMIGKIGTLLGHHNINIGGMEVARASAGTDAYTIINVDLCPSRDLLDGIKAIEGIKKVKFVEL